MPTTGRLAAKGAVFLILAFVSAPQAWALGQESFGPAGEQISRSPDWPKGVEDVLRHRSRVYWYDVNGSEAAYYDGDMNTVNELLDLYSRSNLAKHPVVIRPGRPSAKSFHGKLTPYVVEFDVPGSFSIYDALERGSTGLYSVAPRMTIYFDAALAEQLDKLKIPKNVTLYELAVRVEDALKYADDVEVGLRYRAIVALGDAADASGASIKALRRAAASEHASIRAAGEAALGKVAAAKDPAEQTLSRHFSTFPNWGHFAGGSSSNCVSTIVDKGPKAPRTLCGLADLLASRGTPGYHRASEHDLFSGG